MEQSCESERDYLKKASASMARLCFILRISPLSYTCSLTTSPGYSKGCRRTMPLSGSEMLMETKNSTSNTEEGLVKQYHLIWQVKPVSHTFHCEEVVEQ